jgi:hypothetical protein
MAGTTRTSQPTRTSRRLPKHQGEQDHRFNARPQHELSAPERRALTILVRAAVASLIKER